MFLGIEGSEICLNRRRIRWAKVAFVDAGGDCKPLSDSKSAAESISIRPYVIVELGGEDQQEGTSTMILPKRGVGKMRKINWSNF